MDGIVDFGTVNFNDGSINFKRAEFGNGDVLFEASDKKGGEINFIHTVWYDMIRKDTKMIRFSGTELFINPPNNRLVTFGTGFIHDLF